jgi:hypothetical protein
MTVLVARDSHGQPLAIATAVIDDTACLIMHAVAISRDARWALHDYLVRILVARCVRYLLAEGGGVFGALGFTHNVQHYQHLLGYELRHIVPVPACRGPQWRRRLAVAMMAASVAFIALPVAEGAAVW